MTGWARWSTRNRVNGCNNFPNRINKKVNDRSSNSFTLRQLSLFHGDSLRFWNSLRRSCCRQTEIRENFRIRYTELSLVCNLQGEVHFIPYVWWFFLYFDSVTKTLFFRWNISLEIFFSDILVSRACRGKGSFSHSFLRPFFFSFFFFKYFVINMKFPKLF